MLNDSGLHTPFIRFLNGTPLHPPNNIHEAASILLKLLDNGHEEDAFHKLIIFGKVSGQHAIVPEATWFAIFRDFLNMYAREFSKSENSRFLMIELLHLMTQTPIENAWKEVQKFIIEHIDFLSGWNRCWQKNYGENQNIFMGEDGNYYVNDLEPGTHVQIEGLKTLPEARLEFVIGTIYHSYGVIKRILYMFALFSISKDFETNPTAYPHSLRLYIPEANSGMTIFQWHRNQFHQIRSTKWRPLNNLCDPEWLAEEMIARMTDSTTDNAWIHHIKKYSKNEITDLDTEAPYQIDYVLDTSLKIGDDEEIYFEFEGKNFRWINSTSESKPILSVGFKEMNNPKEAETLVNQLLSFLVWQHQVPIGKSYGVSGPRRNIPLTWGPRMIGGIKIDPQYLLSKYIKPNSVEKERALSFYKEGLNSESVFYKFFNFWKILELLIPDVPQKTQWIKEKLLNIRLEKKRTDELIVKEKDVVNYLFKSGRCAIAHVTKGEKFINPDDVEDNIRISKDVHLVEELARIAISTVDP